MLADLGGGLIASGRQGEFDQPAITEVFADSGMIHLYAQSIGPGVRVVRIEFPLERFVGPDAADIGFQQQIFPLGSGATGEDTRNCDAEGRNRKGV